MATLEQLERFAGLSRKEQVDAAFNSGATSLDEANQMVNEALARREGTATTGGFFSQIKNQLDNLTPEQAAGLLRFGTQLSRGIQPGETLISSIGEATQSGLATTQAARDANRLRQAKEQEAQLAVLEAARKQRETRLKEQKAIREQQEFEFERSPLGILGPQARFFTPESRATFAALLADGDQEGALASLIADPTTTGSSGTNVTVNLPDGNIAPTKTQTSREQDRLSLGLKRVDELNRVTDKFADEFLTIAGRAKAKVGRGLDILGLPSNEFTKFNTEAQQFFLQVEQFFQQYRKEITGAAAALGELQQLREALIGGFIGPDEFKGRINTLLTNAQQDIQRTQGVLREGFPGNPPGIQTLNQGGQGSTLPDRTFAAPQVLRFERGPDGTIRQVQ